MARKRCTFAILPRKMYTFAMLAGKRYIYVYYSGVYRPRADATEKRHKSDLIAVSETSLQVVFLWQWGAVHVLSYTAFG